MQKSANTSATGEFSLPQVTTLPSRYSGKGVSFHSPVTPDSVCDRRGFKMSETIQKVTGSFTCQQHSLDTLTQRNPGRNCLDTFGLKSV